MRQKELRFSISLRAAAEAARAVMRPTLFGGAQVYEAFLPYADTMYTEVDHEFDGMHFSRVLRGSFPPSNPL